jgi:hypothetical protein
MGRLGVAGCAHLVHPSLWLRVLVLRAVCDIFVQRQQHWWFRLRRSTPVTTFQDKATFIWGVADLIRDNFNRGKYKDVILPFTMLRCVDTVLEPTRQQVVERYHRFKNNYRCCN